MRQSTGSSSLGACPGDEARPGIRTRSYALGRLAAAAGLLPVLALSAVGCGIGTGDGEILGFDPALFAEVWDLSEPEPAVPAPSALIVDPLVLQEGVRERIEAGLASGVIRAAGEPLHAGESVAGFYGERAYEPVWIAPGGLSSEARDLAAILRQADRDGLRPADYHAGTLDSLLVVLGDGPADDPHRLVDLDLLLTDGFLLFSAHLLSGRLDPISMESTWTAEPDGVDMVEVLQTALAEDGVRGALYTLRPRSPQYEGLRMTFVRYRDIAARGGWGTVPTGAVLDPGATDPRIPALRARLFASGDLAPGEGAGPSMQPAEPPRPAAPADDPYYDEALVDAVRAFQVRHGLEPDGRLGPATTAALNVPVEDRIRQLEVNLERWRWLPRDLGERHFLVNIPGFTVSVVEQGQEVRRIRAIVGQEYRQTPVFSATMTYLALAPYWNVPPGIAANDKLPEIRRDPGYVDRQRMVLFDAATNQPVDATTVDWQGMGGGEFNRRFRLRQEPGPQNALGTVKFMFPNRHNVYLHDTPSRELFDRAARDFSSGCIRVENPLELAAHLLRDSPEWGLERIRETVAQGRERAVTLPHPYRVHIQYWTAWVETDGEVHFREDIYDRDPRVLRALGLPLPGT